MIIERLHGIHAGIAWRTAGGTGGTTLTALDVATGEARLTVPFAGLVVAQHTRGTLYVTELSGEPSTTAFGPDGARWTTPGAIRACGAAGIVVEHGDETRFVHPSGAHQSLDIEPFVPEPWGLGHLDRHAHRHAVAEAAVAVVDGGRVRRFVPDGAGLREIAGVPGLEDPFVFATGRGIGIGEHVPDGVQVSARLMWHGGSHAVPGLVTHVVADEAHVLLVSEHPVAGRRITILGREGRLAECFPDYRVNVVTAGSGVLGAIWPTGAAWFDGALNAVRLPRPGTGLALVGRRPVVGLGERLVGPEGLEPWRRDHAAPSMICLLETLPEGLQRALVGTVGLWEHGPVQRDRVVDRGFALALDPHGPALARDPHLVTLGADGAGGLWCACLWPYAPSPALVRFVERTGRVEWVADRVERLVEATNASEAVQRTPPPWWFAMVHGPDPSVAPDPAFAHVLEERRLLRAFRAGDTRAGHALSVYYASVGWERARASLLRMLPAGDA
ncbi:MAG: hypothetical protein H6737_10400 [Alphaproteobacteria bacterium]|nr:hypothetical protein [Alphaproteobacteria bacterium]